MIQRVGLAVASVTKDRQHLQWCVDVTAETTNELVLVPHLQHTARRRWMVPNHSRQHVCQTEAA